VSSACNCGRRHDHRDLKTTTAGEDHSSPAGALFKSNAGFPTITFPWLPLAKGHPKDRRRQGRRATRKFARMIASSSSAVSAVESRPGRSATTASRTGWAFQPLPNLNRETRQAVGKARCGWTFTTICTELGYACHKRRATWDQQRLGIGLRALARESGQDVRKVRRDCAALAKLGLVVIHRPKVLHTADPTTGKITTKSKGRCENTVIYLTITEAVLRPAWVNRGTIGGTTVAPPTAACKGHGGTTVIEQKQTKQTENTPDGGADGVGTPPAAEAGLTAGEAPASILPVNAGRDEPDVPAGRILPSQGTASPTRQRHLGQEERRSAAEASEAWHRRDPQQEAARREYLEAKARKAAMGPQSADHPPRQQDVEAAKAEFLAALAVT